MTLGLSRIPRSMLELLLAAIERRRLECPFSEADLLDAGFQGDAADAVAMLGALDRAGALAVLRVAIAERVHRPPPRLDLVWTGPETRATLAQSTRAVVERLFESARRSVIVGGYAFDTPEIVEPLHRAMVDDERALVTSANFTDRGQTRNVEAGVLVEDRTFAGELGAQWRQLVNEQLMAKYRG